MNKIFRVIWSRAKSAYIVVPETAKRCGRAGAKVVQTAALATVLTASVIGGDVSPAYAATMPKIYTDPNKVVFVRYNQQGLTGYFYHLESNKAISYAILTYTSEDYTAYTVTKTGSLEGNYHIVAGESAAVNSGSYNAAVGDYSVIISGKENIASNDYATVLGGENNTASGVSSSVSGGTRNIASGKYASVLGGYYNEATGNWSTVSAGYNNKAMNTMASVSGGYSNKASGYAASISAGYSNIASGNYASISGGWNNKATNTMASVSGGTDNTASGYAAAISGGQNNTALGSWSMAVGGQSSVVTGQHSTGVAGGSTATTAADALAAGKQSVVTVENGTAIGYQATTDEAGTIAFGHDKGDVAGYTVTWEQDSDGNNKPTLTATYYEAAAYNRLVKVDYGKDDHDVAIMAQLPEVQVGEGLSLDKAVDETTHKTTYTISLANSSGAIAEADAITAASGKFHVYADGTLTANTADTALVVSKDGMSAAAGASTLAVTNDGAALSNGTNSLIAATKEGAALSSGSSAIVVTDGTVSISSGKTALGLTDNGADFGGSVVTGVAAADLSANSQDAVNGSQLYATNQRVTSLETDVAELKQSSGSASVQAAANKAAIAEEATARKEADTALGERIDSNKTAIASEATARKEADTALGERIDSNASAIEQNSRSISRLGMRLNKVGAGAAALAALHPLDFDPEDKWSFAAGLGNYAGENAAAIGAFYRPDEKVMLSLGGTFGNDENMVNAGISFALDRTSRPLSSRSAMAQELEDMRGKLAEMTAKMERMERLLAKLDIDANQYK